MRHQLGTRRIEREQAVLECSIARKPKCAGRRLKIRKNFGKDLFTTLRRREQSLYIFEHERRGPMIGNDTEILSIQKMAMIVLEVLMGRSHARATDNRIRLTRGTAQENPILGPSKRALDFAILFSDEYGILATLSGCWILQSE